MFWITLLLCLSIQVLTEEISDDYTGKENERDSQNVNASIEDKVPTRRLFDWFKNLFGITSNAANNKSVKHVNRTGIELKIEKTEENILESINRIANAIEKISNNVDLQLHMMVPSDKAVELSNLHDITRERDRVTRNSNTTEEIIESSISDSSKASVMEPIYRIANTVEKINNNLELQLHMMLANKDRKHTNRSAGRNHRRSTFEWLYNLLFGNNKTEQPLTVKGNNSLYDLLTKTYDENTEGEVFEAVNRIGIALERINSNLELQLHMKLDCKCEEHTHVKRKFEAHKRFTRMDRNFYEIVNNSNDNKPLSDVVRRKREISKNETEYSVLENKLTENTVAPIAKTIDTPDTDVNTLKVPLASTTELVSEKKERKEPPKILRRQDADEVKQKLLNYIYESYNEVINKIDPLSKMKSQYQNDDLYKIGYIMSNIDTLEVNLKNMKKDVDVNKQSFEETKILSLLDTFMASNRIVTSLVESLKLLNKPMDVIKKQTTSNPQ